MLKTNTGIAFALGCSLVAGTAAAEEPSAIVEEYGLALTAGGGVGGFTQEEMRDATQVSGLWDVRAAFGTRKPLAVEAAYIGSAQTIDAIGLDANAVLLGTAVEAVARVNVMPAAELTPYLFVGGAWKRYDLTNVDTNTSDVSDYDNLLEIPMGVGLSYRYASFVGDLRGEFRPAAYADMVPLGDGTTDSAAMHTWGASARLGYAF